MARTFRGIVGFVDAKDSVFKKRDIEKTANRKSEFVFSSFDVGACCDDRKWYESIRKHKANAPWVQKAFGGHGTHACQIMAPFFGER